MGADVPVKRPAGERATAPNTASAVASAIPLRKRCARLRAGRLRFGSSAQYRTASSPLRVNVLPQKMQKSEESPIGFLQLGQTILRFLSAQLFQLLFTYHSMISRNAPAARRLNRTLNGW